MKSTLLITGLCMMMLTSSAFALTCYSTGKNVDEKKDYMQVKNSSSNAIYFFVSIDDINTCPSNMPYIKVKSEASTYAYSSSSYYYIIVCNKDLEYRCSIPFDDQRKLKICKDDQKINSDGKCEDIDERYTL